MTKEVNCKKLIDTLTMSLENKYIDIVNDQEIQCAVEILDQEIDNIKTKLDVIEAYYGRIELDIHSQPKEKLTTEKEFNLIYYMSTLA